METAVADRCEDAPAEQSAIERRRKQPRSERSRNKIARLMSELAAVQAELAAVQAERAALADTLELALANLKIYRERKSAA